MSRGPAPIYVDTCSLCEWLLGRFGDDDRVLPQRICRSSLTLLDRITLALKGRRTEDQLDQADEELIALRTQLRLAAAIGALNDRQLVHALERLDTIGRQLGGWLRSLEPC